MQTLENGSAWQAKSAGATGVNQADMPIYLTALLAMTTIAVVAAVEFVLRKAAQLMGLLRRAGAGRAVAVCVTSGTTQPRVREI